MSNFSIEVFQSAIDDMVSNRVKLDRLRIADDEIAGLRAVLSKEGRRISFHAHYKIEGLPFQMHIGDAPELSVEEARKVAIYVMDRAKAGINIQEESRKRMLDELRHAAA